MMGDLPVMIGSYEELERTKPSVKKQDLSKICLDESPPLEGTTCPEGILEKLYFE